MRYHKQYFKYTCSGSSDQVGEKLYKRFVGDGVYIPFNLDGSLDKETIKENLPVLIERRTWLRNIFSRLDKKRSFRAELGQLRDLKKEFNKVQAIKIKYYKNPSKKNTELVKARTKNFLKTFEKYLDGLYFFHSFRFPVDHFYMRAEYDRYKGIDTPEGRQSANNVYMLRKIVEDGGIDKKRGRSDLQLRALINTVYLRITSFNEIYLDEDLRYDIESLLEQLEGHMRKGKGRLLNRLANWKVKTQKAINYYSKLIDNKTTKDDILKKLYDDRSKARYALKNYVYSKEAKVYKFWTGKSELYRKLFALETILIHEVGRLDNSYGSERRDVAQVVINRVKNPLYNSIESDEPLYEHLKKANVKSTEKYRWLNVLFKQGEFSFTYFFIPASRGIFCPDQSRTAKRLRAKNLRIILSQLKKNDTEFSATRYFSRASMLGRIDMAQLWSEYKPLDERPGPEIAKSSKRFKKYSKLLKKNAMTFLYSFINEKGQMFEVYRYRNSSVLYRPKLKKFYNYRNPHHFRYFDKEEGY